MAQPIGALRAALSASSASFEQDMRQARNAVRTNARGMETAMSRVRRVFTRTLRSVFSFRSAIGTLAGSAGMGLLIKRSVEAADTIAKTADSIGISTDALQEYRYIAERSGVATSALDNGLGAFTRRLGQMRQGTGQLNSEMEKFDVALRDQMASADSAGDALNIFFRALEDVENQSDRAALMAAAFGRTAGVAMTNMVGQTDALRQRFHRLGLSIDEDVLRRAEEGKDSIDDLSEVIRTSFMRAMLELAPSMADTADSMADWVGENKEFLTQDVPGAMREVASAIGWVATTSAKAVGFLKEVHEWLGHISGRAPNMGVHFVEEISRIQKAIRRLEEDRERLAAQQEFFPGMGGDVSEIDDRIEALKRELYTIRQQRDAYYEKKHAREQSDAPDVSEPDTPPRPPPAPEPGGPRTVGPGTEKPDDMGGVDVTPRDIEQAYTRMYDSVGRQHAEWYDFQVRMLEQQRDEWIKTTGDQELAWAAFYSNLEELDEEFLDRQESTKDKWQQMWENAFDGWGAHWSRGLNDMVWGADTSFKDIARSFAQMITQMLIQIQMLRAMEAFSGTGVGASLGNFFAGSADGGGYTGNRPRVGGIDGKGGFPMIMHPQETIIDHTKQHQQQAPQNNTRIINVMDPGIVGDYMQTDEGEEMIMNVVQRNQGAIRG